MAASTKLSIRRNGVEFAYVTFAAGSKQGTFTLAADTVCFPGDLISVVAPASQDAAAADLTFVMVGTQS